jgi:predicted Zn-dependent peptidase
MYHDQPPFGPDDRLKEAYFGRHPLALSVLGTVKSVTDLPVEAMRAYFDRRYSPDNIALIGSGKIDFEALVKSAQQICGGWKPTAAGRELSPAPPHRGFECVRQETATQEYVLELSAGPGATDDDRYAAKLLATILGDDSGSRLYWALVDTGLAEHASLGHHDYQGTGIFMTYMSCAPESAQENLRKIAELYAQAERDGVTTEELAQAKSKINSRVVLSSERPRGRLFSVGGNWMQRHQYHSVRDELAAIDAVTVEKVVDVLRQYPLLVSTTLAIGPLAELAAPE